MDAISLLLLSAACGALLLAIESRAPVVRPKGPIHDLGFELTKGVFAWLAKRPQINELLALVNTALCGSVIVWGGFRIAMHESAHVVVCALLVYFFRAFCGFCTALPSPKEFTKLAVDWPPSERFFFFYSGHTAIFALMAIDMAAVGFGKLSLLFHFLNALQIIRLVGTRGHYSIDVIIGLYVAYSLYYLVPANL